jgi:NAD(P)-dependent dehydrogenase (short-subunit alcohol dehydrogenase family)
MSQEDVVVITGGAGGMGVECARAMAGAGQILLVDVNQDRLDSVAKDLAGDGISVDTRTCDVTDRAAVAALVDDIGRRGRLKSVVHTAGISPTMASGRRVIEVDLVGTALLVDALLPLVSQGTAVVCIASIAGHLVPQQDGLDLVLDDPLREDFIPALEELIGREVDPASGYVLAKRGVIRLCQRVAMDWGNKGGRITSISPGLIDTPMSRQELASQPLMQPQVDMTAIKRPPAPGQSTIPGRPQDIAATAAFLCSEGGSFISGCDVLVDGGLVASLASIDALKFPPSY